MNPTIIGEKDKRLIQMLASGRWRERKFARAAFIRIGSPIVPTLIQLLSHPRSDVRWEAAFILGVLQEPSSAPALVKALEDEAVEVRWRAAEALICMKRHSLIPLFERLKERFESVHMREGARHVLHGLDQSGSLAEPSLKVLAALDSIEPAMTVPWAVEHALELSTPAEPPDAPPKLTPAEKEREYILHLLIDNPQIDEE
jgi:hypothetical protein